MRAVYERGAGSPFASRSEALGTRGMVATSQVFATQAGLDLLRSGGNAVDAAIAANAVLGLTEPTGCGIGGDLFAMVWEAGKDAPTGLNASGRAPRSLNLDVFAGRGLKSIPSRGPLPVSVPGAVDGWHELHKRYGRKDFAELLAPAIALAHEGFPVAQLTAAAWASNARALADYPGFADTFMPDGEAPGKGRIFRNPRLGATYELLAEGGREAFYRGEIAWKIAEYMRENGGYLDEADLASHRSEWVRPVASGYRGHDVYALPPNTQGIATLQILNLLEQHDLASAGFGSAGHLHLLTEAKKLAFEDRARFYADPSFAPSPVDELISKEYALARGKLIDPARAATQVLHGDPRLDTPQTVYLAAGDSDGLVVSLIQSNFRGMGSGMTPADLGFVLHNRGQLFNLDPDHPNALLPGKRPFNTIIPGFARFASGARLAFGVMGGDMQPQAQAQVIANVVDFGMDLQAAGDAPRAYHGGSSSPTGRAAATGGGSLALEPGFGPEVRGELAGMGHRMSNARGVFGGYQAVMHDAESGVLTGASDPRKDGQAAGLYSG